jgi:hypothetical protein
MTDVQLKLHPNTGYKILKVYAIQYQLTGESGKKGLKNSYRVYSPIVAQPNSSWPIIIEV